MHFCCIIFWSYKMRENAWIFTYVVEYRKFDSLKNFALNILLFILDSDNRHCPRNLKFESKYVIFKAICQVALKLLRISAFENFLSNAMFCYAYGLIHSKIVDFAVIKLYLLQTSKKQENILKKLFQTVNFMLGYNMYKDMRKFKHFHDFYKRSKILQKWCILFKKWRL